MSFWPQTDFLQIHQPMDKEKVSEDEKQEQEQWRDEDDACSAGPMWPSINIKIQPELLLCPPTIKNGPVNPEF